MPTAAFRDAAERAAERSSLRQVSREIGMTPPGLQAFLDGTTPQARTLRKLREWYVREAAASRDVSEESIRAAFALVLDGVPEKKRGAGVWNLLAVVEKVYEDAGEKRPEWMDKLKR